MAWSFELADHLADAPWPANKEELLDFANRIGAPLAVIENLQRLENDDSVVYYSMSEIWSEFALYGDFMQMGYEEEQY